MKPTLALLGALATASAPAYAADPQIIVTATTPRATQAKIVEAAETVCRTALRHDAFGDFGSLDECVANSVAGAHLLKHSYQAQDISRTTERN